MSLLVYPKVIPYTSFNALKSFVFELYAPNISAQNVLIDPVTLTLQPQNLIISFIVKVGLYLKAIL